MGPEEYVEYMRALLALMVERYQITEKQADAFENAILEKLAKNKGQVTEDMMQLKAKDLGFESDITFDITQASPYFKQMVERRYQTTVARQEEQRRKQKESEYERKLYEYKYGGGEYGKGTAEERELEAEKAVETQRKTAEETVEWMKKASKAPYDVWSPEGRTRLAEMVRNKQIPSNVFGKGSEWEKWQHGEATRGMISGAAQKQAQASQLINSVTPQILSAMRNANTTEEVDQIEAQARDVLAPLEGLTSQMGDVYGQQLLGLSFQANLAKERIQEAEGQLLRTEYQPWYAKFMAGRSSYTKGTDMGQQFNWWASQQPEFQQAKLAKETEMYKEWPELYGAYKAAPVYERTQAGGFMPWVQSKPETRAWYEQERAIRERPKPFRTPTYRMPQRGRV